MDKYFRISALLIFASVGGGQGALIFKSYEDLLQALEYDDPCNPEVELLRQSYLKPEILGENNPNEKSEPDLRRLEYISTVEMLQQPMCNALKLLICNPSTSRCDCGHPSQEALFQGQEQGGSRRQGFVVEDGVCRWSEGAYCQSEVEYLPKKASQWCVNGFLCLLTNKEGTKDEGIEVCSNDEILKYAIRNNLQSTKSLNEALYSGKICSCKKTTLSLAVDKSQPRKGWMG